MKHKILIGTMVAVAAVGALTVSSCKSKQEISATYAGTQFPTTWISTNGDGTVTVRAWGQGSTEKEAIRQAKKNAVNDVIFKGLGGGSYERQALVTGVNPRERNRDYFDEFFSDKGDYNNYVGEASRKKDESQIHAESASRHNNGVVLIVKTSDLRSKLIEDGIIPKR